LAHGSALGIKSWRTGVSKTWQPWQYYLRECSENSWFE